MTSSTAPLVAICAMIIAIVIRFLLAKNKVLESREDGDAGAKPFIGEVFPQIEPLLPMEQGVEEKPVSKGFFKKSPEMAVHGAEQSAALPKMVQPVVKEEKNRFEKVVMKNRSDAKKAFIYSEIFNRKY